MSFLDVNIIREQGKFIISVYRNKIGMIHKLLYRCLPICSDQTKSHLELVKLMDV